jgi:hypothetical protein
MRKAHEPMRHMRSIGTGSVDGEAPSVDATCGSGCGSERFSSQSMRLWDANHRCFQAGVIVQFLQTNNDRIVRNSPAGSNDATLLWMKLYILLLPPTTSLPLLSLQS